MGNENTNKSVLLDSDGKQIRRKCIILVIPPEYEVSKYLMLDHFPQQFPYRYVSIGQLIRNEINKKTKYSEIILESLQKNRKISKQLLGMILRTVALRGNFMIRFSVLDDDQLTVWKEFMMKVDVQMIAVIKPQNSEAQNNNQKNQSSQRLTSFNKDIQTVKTSFQAKSFRDFNRNQDIASQIMNFIRKNNL